METMISLLGTVGSIISVSVSLSPASRMMKVQKTKKLDEVPYLFLLLNHLCSLSWATYGFIGGYGAIMINNGISTVIGHCFIGWYHQIKGDLASYMLVYTTAIFASALILISFIPIDIIGWICLISNFALYLGPLETSSKALAEKNPNYIDIFIIGICQVNSLIWMSYGILVQNNFIVAPCLFGAFLCAFQITIYVWANNWFPMPIYEKLSKLLANKK
ncbi:unnamed protein product [Blepharisma stoltei]|uniref:Sugar transporter SWEET n=1 Tax=Blepharisma stoltei TaxID=1481888 RepID=A0AAU9J3L8_9CILI|nr:unnamed protein product [Blepharisma stoltei]